jgi:hypothetical protein
MINAVCLESLKKKKPPERFKGGRPVFKWMSNGVERGRLDSSGSGDGSVFVMNSVPTFYNL